MLRCYIYFNFRPFLPGWLVDYMKYRISPASFQNEYSFSFNNPVTFKPTSHSKQWTNIKNMVFLSDELHALIFFFRKHWWLLVPNVPHLHPFQTFRHGLRHNVNDILICLCCSKHFWACLESRYGNYFSYSRVPSWSLLLLIHRPTLKIVLQLYKPEYLHLSTMIPCSQSTILRRSCSILHWTPTCPGWQMTLTLLSTIPCVHLNAS